MNIHTLLSKRIPKHKMKRPFKRRNKAHILSLPFPERKFLYYYYSTISSNIEIISLSVPLLAVGSLKRRIL